MIKILGPNDPALDALKESIEENPDLGCELTILPWEKYRGVLDETLAAPSPDYDAVCIPGHIWLPQLADDGLLKAFGELTDQLSITTIEEYDEHDIFPSIRAECRFTGRDGISRQYVLPLFTDGHIVFYRGDLVALPDVVAPSDWHKHLEKVTLPNGMKPFGMKAHNSEIFLDFLPYFWDFNGQLWNDQQKPLFNSPEGAQALEYYTSLRKFCPENVETFGNGEILNAINSGEVAIVTSWGGQAAAIFDTKNNPQTGNIKTAALKNAWNATWGVSIPNRCEDENAVKTLAALMKLMGKDGDAKVTRIAGSPVRRSSYSTTEKEKYPWLASQQAMLENCKMLPIDPTFGVYLGSLYGEVYKAFCSEKSAATALADAAR